MKSTANKTPAAKPRPDTLRPSRGVAPLASPSGPGRPAKATGPRDKRGG